MSNPPRLITTPTVNLSGFFLKELVTERAMAIPLTVQGVGLIFDRTGLDYQLRMAILWIWNAYQDVSHAHFPDMTP